MRVLLDECLPRRLAKALVGHEVLTVPGCGWASKRNGELLKLAEGKFEVFVTMDQGLEYQQNLGGSKLAVIVLVARSNRFGDLWPLVPQLLRTLTDAKAGSLVHVGR